MTENFQKPDNNEKACFNDNMLLQLARDLRKAGYAPYSCYTVGAACRASSGTTYFGCNIENASYPVGICAERVAAAAAIAHGERKIEMIAIAGGKSGEEPDGDLRPCGMCAQFLAEFMDMDGQILIADGQTGCNSLRLSDILPQAFTLSGKIDNNRCSE